jgi:AraC-like DNA-binding protein
VLSPDEIAELIAIRLAELPGGAGPDPRRWGRQMKLDVAEKPHHMRIGWFIPADAPLGVMFHDLENPEPEISLHTHDYLELGYLHHGSLTHYVESGQMELEPGDSYFLNPHVLHEVRLAPNSLLINILVRPEIFNGWVGYDMRAWQVFADYTVEGQWSGAKTQAYLLFRSSPENADRIRETVEGIAVECIRQPPQWQLAAQLSLSMLFLLLARTYSKEPEGPAGNSDQFSTERQFAAAVRAYLVHHLQDATLDGLAKALGYSPTYLSTLIKNSFGQPYSQLLREIRLGRARESLVNSDMPLKTIAQLVGYNSENHLRDAFSKRFGVTPGHFRAHERGTKADQ